MIGTAGPAVGRAPRASAGVAGRRSRAARASIRARFDLDRLDSARRRRGRALGGEAVEDGDARAPVPAPCSRRTNGTGRPSRSQASATARDSAAPKIGCASGAVRKSPSRPGRAVDAR